MDAEGPNSPRGPATPSPNAERLFELTAVGRLDDEGGRDALVVPAAREGVAFHPGAVSEILRRTRGYPYFLQEWASMAWARKGRSAAASGETPEGARREIATRSRVRLVASLHE